MRKLQWSSFIFSHSPLKTSSIVGTNVVNFKGESLGDMREVIIDPCTGKVAYVVVSFGWFLGMAEKLFAVPICTNVVNFKGESLGDMREVIIDPCTGKVAYVVVSFGWFLGMAEKLFAV